MILTTWINGITNDIVQQDGYIISNNPILTEAYSRIRTPRGTYLIDQNFGSLLFTKFNSRNKPSSNDITELINDALLPMKNAGRVQKYITQLIYPITTFSITYKVILYTLDSTELQFTDILRF